MDPNRIIAASSWTVNAKTAIVRRYVYSTLAAERPDYLQSVAKALASRGSSRLCQQLPPGEEHVRNIMLQKNILFKLLTRFRFAKKFKSNYQIISWKSIRRLFYDLSFFFSGLSCEFDIKLSFLSQDYKCVIDWLKNKVVTLFNCHLFKD